MAHTLRDIIKELPPERRQRIEDRKQEILERVKREMDIIEN